MRTFIIGTRESKLAVTQAKWVMEELKKAGVPNEFTLKYISTKGDRKQNVSLAKVGGTGIFIQDIEEALEKKEIDFAVHSMKDLPAMLDDRFIIGSVPIREDHRDAFIGRNGIKLADLQEGAIIGTSSARRAAQIKAILPHVETKWIRGAVDARIKQLEEGKYDGIILAVAGLKRLGIEKVITEYLPADTFIPAVGQGALAIECRSEDDETKQVLRTINDVNTETATITERTFVRLLDEEDKAPIGAYATVENNDIILYTSVASINGEQILTFTAKGVSPEEVVTTAANELMKKGAKELIKEAKWELGKE